ncbi:MULTISPECIES: GNAT family N-acetyltransferase [Bacillaceae]|uniref:GNAT family N-acetyltransferase n=1 Tax=Bacillaceae TaxID=186817 RepID=UPI0011881B8A|nr:N-acetyltransferase [Bacillus sp. S3]QCJ43894.1 GNAT family N-acetyltransferase [Bacillus sp. S3]
MKIQIEPLRNRDAPLIPELIKSGMNRKIFPLTIFSSKGYEAYLNKWLTIAEKHRKVKFYGAFTGERLAGYTEWRVLEEALFLNNIYVFPEYQGLRIGRTLLVEHGKQLLDQFGRTKISLDVFADNMAAINWYKKIGFVKIGSSNWYVREQTAVTDWKGPSGGCWIENYPNAESEQTAYGFSQLMCSTRNGTYQIGRITDQYYRITNPSALYDTDLLQYLNGLDPGRRLLIVTNKEVPQPHVLLCESNRMTARFN